jgi:hypothetical protein
MRASVLYIWVQFADYRIEPGSPCPCGSDDLRRINDEWAICASCESTLLVDTRPQSSGVGDSIVVDAGQPEDDSDADPRLRIFMPEGGRIGDERKRLARLRVASGNGESLVKLKAAAERKEAQAREREEKKEAQAREREEKTEAEAQAREEKKAQIRATRDNKRLERQEARNRSREQNRQRREAERDARSGPKPRTPAPAKKPAAPRPQQQSSGATLDRFTNVRLWAPDTQQRGRYWGYGYDRKGRFMLLEVTLQLTSDGVPVEDPAQPGRALHAVNAVRSDAFSGALDADALLARADGMLPEEVLSLG